MLSFVRVTVECCVVVRPAKRKVGQVRKEAERFEVVKGCEKQGNIRVRMQDCGACTSTPVGVEEDQCHAVEVV